MALCGSAADNARISPRSTSDASRPALQGAARRVISDEVGDVGEPGVVGHHQQWQTGFPALPGHRVRNRGMGQANTEPDTGRARRGDPSDVVTGGDVIDVDRHAQSGGQQQCARAQERDRVR